MTVHLTARLAWHDDGWNGRICEKPDCNTYCVGMHSFPGDVVARERNLALETENAGAPIAKLSGAQIPAFIIDVVAVHRLIGPNAGRRLRDIPLRADRTAIEEIRRV